MSDAIVEISRHNLMAVRLALPLLILAALILRAFSFTSTGLDWDESLYIVIAQRWLQGDLPYVAIWDQHPMGLPALFGLVAYVHGDAHGDPARGDDLGSGRFGRLLLQI